MSDSIKFAQGAQTVRCVPVDEMAIVRRVTSATYRIDDLREGDGTSRRAVVASTAATAPTVSTTLGAAAGPSTVNPRRVTVASLSGIRVGGVYLITAAGASDEAVTVTRIYTATLELELSRALTRPFASGVAFQGVELEGSFPSDVAADEMRLDNGGGPFQVTWIYTIGSVQYVVPRELWLTRYGMAPWVRFDECEPHLPGLAQSIGDAVDPASAIRGATDDALAHLLETTSAATSRSTSPSASVPSTTACSAAAAGPSSTSRTATPPRRPSTSTTSPRASRRIGRPTSTR
jgi:hypothetical protein